MAVLTAFLVACAVTPLLMRLAPLVGAVDAPNADVKTHTQATPLLGGVAIIIGGVVGLLLTGVQVPMTAVLALVLLCAMGLLKDITRRDLSPKLQFFVQIVSCTAIVLSVTQSQQLNWLELAAVIVFGVALINGINFLDVSDGLCASVAAVIFAGLAVLGVQMAGLCVAAAILGFLVWNRPRAKVFMGDAGSFFIGGMLVLLFADGMLVRSWAPGVLLLLLVPFAELGATALIRLSKSKSITQGDASHVSLILLNGGSSPYTVIALFAGAAALGLALAAMLS